MRKPPLVQAARVVWVIAAILLLGMLKFGSFDALLREFSIGSTPFVQIAEFTKGFVHGVTGLQPSIPSCGSEIVADTLQKILLEVMEKGKSHQALLLHTRQADGEVPKDARPFRLSIVNHRERGSIDSTRRCSADVQLGYDQQWLTDRIANSSMSARERRDFNMVSGLLGINLSDRSLKLNYTVQLTERGQTYVEIAD